MKGSDIFIVLKILKLYIFTLTLFSVYEVKSFGKLSGIHKDLDTKSMRQIYKQFY